MKKKQGMGIEDSRWEVKRGPGYGDRPPSITKQEMIQDMNDELHVGRRRIAFKNTENVWIFKWGKSSTDKKKRSIEYQERRGEQTTWEDTIDE